MKKVNLKEAEVGGRRGAEGVLSACAGSTLQRFRPTCTFLAPALRLEVRLVSACCPLPPRPAAAILAPRALCRRCLLPVL